MKWQQLIDLKDEYLKVGTCFRFHPCDFFAGESVVEIMICSSSSDYAAFEFFVTAGYESGTRIAFVPLALMDKDNQLRTSWLIENWYKHIYPESNLHDVYVGRKRSIKKLPFKKV